MARRHPQTARVLLTGWPEEVPTGQLERLRIGALLPKPWDDAELKETLRRQLAAPGGG